MLEHQKSITIDAPIDLAWRVLADVEHLPEWTSSMRSVQMLGSESLRRGSRVRIKQPWLPAATWTVELFDPPRHFTWRSRMGSVDTSGSHLLEERGQTTLATFAVQHSGPGAFVVALLTAPLTRRYVERELLGLKTRAEWLAAGTPG